VWGYALAWALLNDRMKLLAYWILGHTEAGATPGSTRLILTILPGGLEKDKGPSE